MHEDILGFVRKIYNFCDEHFNEKFLFPLFVNFYPENKEYNKKDLTEFTSKIVFRLIKKGVLEEVSRDSNFHTPYGLYKILEHENLTFKKETFLKDPYDFDYTRDL